LIDAKNVIRMKINLNLEYNLAHAAHMYICKSRINSKYEFVKCQTLKPYMIINNPICHYIDEEADIARNPFRMPCGLILGNSIAEIQTAYFL